MNSKQIIILALGLGLGIYLFLQPKHVVEQSPQSITASSDTLPASPEHVEAGFQAPPAMDETDKFAIKRLRSSLNDAINSKKRFIFADSLAELFSKYQHFDSAVFYLNTALPSDNEGGVSKTLIADAYYNVYLQVIKGPSYETPFSFQRMQEAQKSAKISGSFYQDVLKNDSLNIAARARLQLLKLSEAQAPMPIILSIKELADNNPDSFEANYIMGKLAMFVSWYDRAVPRFEKATTIQPDHYDSWIYLGVCYKKTNASTQAKEAFEKALKLVEEQPDNNQEAKKIIKKYLTDFQ